MYQKRTLYGIAAFLLVESVVILLIRSKLPVPARALTSAINVVAALALIVLARQKDTPP
jgi:hypothetical protein